MAEEQAEIVTGWNLVELVEIPRISDDGILIFAQTPDHIPFDIRRIYWILGADPTLPRGCHAHRETMQLLFCIQGSIQMIVDNGSLREEVILNRPEQGLLLRPMVWHEMHGFRSDTVLLGLASDIFKESDYIRDHEIFIGLLRGNVTT